MESTLQDRLRDSSEAFNGLLSLIPAKMYYGEDTSNQWMQKQQTKEEAAAARRGKLDPDSDLNRNAKQVMDERAQNKRKLREMEVDDEDGDEDGDELFAVDEGDLEKPGEGLKKPAEAPNKKQKKEEDDVVDAEAEAEAESRPQPAHLTKKQQKKADKKERKQQKAARKAAKEAAGDVKQAEEPSILEAAEIQHDEEPSRTDAAETQADEASNSAPKPKKNKKQRSKKDEEPAAEPAAAPQEALPASTNKTQTEEPTEAIQSSSEFTGLQDIVEGSESSTPDSEVQSAIFDVNDPSADIPAGLAELASTTTSVSSTAGPTEKPKHKKIPADSPELRARLAAKIEALRAARKADGPDGKPIRTRQELIESRRFKQAQRKATKKELRKQAKVDEDLKREEALASNSPSVMSPAVDMDESHANFSFGRVAFGDGSQLSHDLSYVLNRGKKKGVSDPKTALLKVQNQKQHLEDMSEEKRKDISEKEAWLNARRRAQGDKIRDDEALLKKAVKRKESAKRKTDKQWQERAKGVGHAQKQRQKKREDNLQKRRDDKILGKAGKKKKSAGSGGGGKKKGRPGFEGSLGMGKKK